MQQREVHVSQVGPVGRWFADAEAEDVPGRNFLGRPRRCSGAGASKTQPPATHRFYRPNRPTVPTVLPSQPSYRPNRLTVPTVLPSQPSYRPNRLTVPTVLPSQPSYRPNRSTVPTVLPSYRPLRGLDTTGKLRVYLCGPVSITNEVPTMSNTQSPDIKADAHRMIDDLPDDATWDDIMDRIYVRQSIESGIKDAETNNVVDVEEVRRRFGLSP